MGNLSFRIGALMLGGFILMQAVLAIVLSLPGRADDTSFYGLPPPAALEAMVRAIDGAPPAIADKLVESYGGSLFTVRITRRAPPDFQEIPVAMRSLAQSYRDALARHNVVIDGGPGRFNQWLGERSRPLRFLVPIRVTVWLRDGRVLIVTGRPAPGLRAFLARRSMIGLVGGLMLMGLLMLAVRQATRPLTRLTRSVRAFGSDLSAPDAVVEGSRETRALAGAFNEMKGRIGRLVEERTFILAGIAHDMRTYLTRLRLRAEFIADPAQRARAVSDLDQMGDLLDDSLTFAGTDALRGKGLEPVDLAAFTQALMETRLEDGRISVVAPVPCMVLADPAGLTRIFNNLVDNGLRHAPHVRVTVGASGEWLFEDDGPGVPPDQMPMLGQAFARIDPSRDRRTGGAGLGLAIVRALAEVMGGTVAFGRSDLGGLLVGLRFTPG